jgi:hypothetical protein
VDPGDPEEGYVGSGQPAIEREPASVLAAITPLGCRPQPLPLPLRALEVTYQRGDAPGVGLILEFDADEAAREFFDVHTTVIAECVDSRHIDVEVLQTSSSTFVSSRTEEVGQTPSWIEGLMLRGDRLTLIAVADPTSRGVDAVVSALD